MSVGSGESGRDPSLQTLPEAAQGGEGEAGAGQEGSVPRPPVSEAPPPLPPRYATIRKSYTLPVNMSGAAESQARQGRPG